MQRAEALLRNGPDPHFLEPESTEPAHGLSTARAEGPFGLGSPETYARLKSNNFPDEGGPAILELELSDEMAADLIGPEGAGLLGKAIDVRDEVLFLPGYGLEKLLRVWGQISKHIIPVV